MSQSNTASPQHAQSAPQERRPDSPAQLPRWTSQVLLAGHREAEIEHNQVVYRLRITALGKLILTK